MKDYLYSHGLYILGDSAYSLESFLLTPYLQPLPKSPEDGFNFYHSSARITVECAFGEIDLRWGIFWKRLMCSLDHISLIIEGAMCLHNYLVDYRDENKMMSDLNIDRNIFETEISDSLVQPLQIGNDREMTAGQLTNDDKEARTRGLVLQNSLLQALADHDMHRPEKNEWRKNNNTHVLSV